MQLAGYLGIPGHHVENVEYATHPPVVREHKGVIKNNGRRVTLFDQHLREGKADEYGNLFLSANANVSGGAKVHHRSGGTVPLRRSKTLPLWEPFPVTGRVGGFIPWICIAKSVWRAGTG